MKTVSQIPGCLPKNFTLDSLLTPGQFAIWQQINESTVRSAFPKTKGVIKRSRKQILIHPRTFLELTIKK